MKYLIFLFLFILLVTGYLTLLPVNTKAATWWNTNWSYKKQITFNNSAQAENLTNFPVLVKLTSSNFDFNNAQSSGADIRFVDSDDITQLSYEIEKWDATNRQAWIWVKVPQIDSSSSTDSIFMYYGNSGAADAQSATSVWNSNYVLVQHLKETSGTTTADSTSNGNNGTKVSATEPNPMSSGQIDGAQSFDGSNDYINMANQLIPSGNFTISDWFNPAVFGSTENTLSQGTAGGTSNIGLRVNSTGNILGLNGGFALTGTTQLSTNTWYYGTLSYDAARNPKSILYLNSQQEATNNNAAIYTGNAVSIGASVIPGFFFNGSIDEARISNTTRSVNWIQAEYLTGIDTFNSYGVQQCQSTTCPSSTSILPASGVSDATCKDSAPVGTPDLFQINTTKSSANLFFTSTIKDISTYEIDYGTTTNANQFSYEFVTTGLWVSTATINALSPGTTYYFKVKAVNGCNAGGYSQTIKATTSRVNQIVSFYKATSTVIAIPTTSLLLKACQYQVKPGDSLWNIAQNKLGSGSKYQTLINQNPGLTSRSIINTGLVLNINCS